MRRQTLLKMAVTAAIGLVVVSASWAQAPADNKDQDLRNKPITLELTNAPTRAAIDALFKFVPFNHAINQQVDGIVSVSLNDVPFEQALRTICRVNDPALTWRRDEGNVYVIDVKKQAADLTAAGTGALTGAETAATEEVQPEKRVTKIQLNYATAADIGQIFGATAITSRANQFTMSNNNSGGFGGSSGSSWGNSGSSGFGNSGGSSWGSSGSSGWGNSGGSSWGSSGSSSGSRWGGF